MEDFARHVRCILPQYLQLDFARFSVLGHTEVLDDLLLGFFIPGAARIACQVGSVDLLVVVLLELLATLLF